MDKILVYEVAGGSGVQKRFDGMHLAGVGGTDLDRQDDRRSAGVESVGGESFGESFLPFGSPRQGCPDRSGGGERVRLFSHLGLRGRAVPTGVEGERGCVYRFTNFCIDFFYV